MRAIKSHVKSIAKAISWRVIGAIDTFAIAYFLTGKTSAAVGCVGLEVLTKSLWYYLHERAWEQPRLANLFGAQASSTH